MENKFNGCRKVDLVSGVPEEEEVSEDCDLGESCCPGIEEAPVALLKPEPARDQG